MLKTRKLSRFIGALTFASAVSVSATEPRTLLVRLEIRFYGTNDVLARQELFVYRDGYILHRWRDGSPQKGPVTLLTVRSQASEVQMTALQGTLKVNRVGAQVGGCNLPLFEESPGGGYSQAQVDWFGKATRHNSFVTDSKFPIDCSSQIRSLVDAILGVAGAAEELDAKRAEELIESIE